MTEILEATFQKRVLKKLKLIPNSMFFTKEARSIRGIPDILGCCNGRFICLELKRSEKEARKTTGRIALQKHFIQKALKYKGYGAVVHPDNLEEVLSVLNLIATD